MITILKQGKTKKEHITYKVTCDSCGCEFKCGIKDLELIEKTPNGARLARCPCCGKLLDVRKR